MINYTLIRSARKTISLRITGDGTVLVRAPLKTPTAYIDRFVKSKNDWITKHLTVQKDRMERKSVFELNYGREIIYRGKAYPITARDGNRAGFDGTEFYLPPGMTTGAIKDGIVRVYRMLAKDLLTGIAKEYSRRMGVAPTAVKVNGAKTRWGSCSAKNSINFSWRLVMAEDEIIDYVVVHELAHIRVHDHSPLFWAVVGSVIPDYQNRRAKLVELQKRLACEDWD